MLKVASFVLLTTSLAVSMSLSFLVDLDSARDISYSDFSRILYPTAAIANDAAVRIALDANAGPSKPDPPISNPMHPIPNKIIPTLFMTFRLSTHTL